MTRVGWFSIFCMVLAALCLGLVVYADFEGETMSRTQTLLTVLTFLGAGFMFVELEIRKLRK